MESVSQAGVIYFICNFYICFDFFCRNPIFSVLCFKYNFAFIISCIPCLRGLFCPLWFFGMQHWNPLALRLKSRQDRLPLSLIIIDEIGCIMLSCSGIRSCFLTSWTWSGVKAPQVHMLNACSYHYLNCYSEANFVSFAEQAFRIGPNAKSVLCRSSCSGCDYRFLSRF